MILMYVRTFRNKNSKRRGVAAYTELIEPSIHSNLEYVKIFDASKDRGVCEVEMIADALGKIQHPQRQHITICTTNHEIAWDFEQMESNQPPEFIELNCWNKVIKAIEAQGLTFQNIQIKEGGIMRQAETGRANTFLAELAKTDKKYAEYL